MSPGASRQRMLARVSAAVSAGMAACFLGLVVLLSANTSYTQSQSFWSSLPDVLIAFVYALVGAVVTLKRPANLVGWALVLAGAGSLLGGILAAYGELALLAKPEAGLPGGTAAAALAAGLWTPLMAGVFLLLVTFPSGAVSSPRMRRFTTLVLLGFGVLWAMITTSSSELSAPLQAYQNPLAVTESKAYTIAAVPIIVACLLSVVFAGGRLVVRFRQSTGQERQQFKWLATSAGLLVVTMPFAAAFNWTLAAGLVFSVELIALPVSVGIAVLRYRLFEIDVIIRRTLVYGLLTALLAGTYLGVVLGLQAVFALFAGGSSLAIAVSTLVVAALFLPVRQRVQALVDRRFYRRRYDARRTTAAFGARLRDEIELEVLTDDLRGVVQETMQPMHVSLWLRQGITP